MVRRTIEEGGTCGLAGFKTPQHRVQWTSRGHSASPSSPAIRWAVVVSRRPAIGIPVPHALTREQIEACERFSLAVWGVGMFDHEASHNGRHGHTCTLCSPVLQAHEAERSRVIRQPWERVAA